ncbi:MAG: HEAT repeat domain-containing protein [Candidatus Thermoplasmatota archaeon]|nr:HEAT repeat domain-containing protein [Candidatus Thermoplasmatota archaeon]
MRSDLQIIVLLFSFAIIHSAAFLTSAEVAWILLWLGYFGVIGVGRAWVANEKQRTAIARKLSDADPDELPDLRLGALLSALQLFIIIPLLMRSSHSIFDLYAVPNGATLSDWLLLGVDLLFRSALDWSEVYGIQLSSIELESMGGRHLFMVLLLTIDFILIQGLLRVFEIRRTITEGVAATVRDPEMAYRLGKRAVPSLLQMLEDQSISKEQCRNVIEALAVLREASACDLIIQRFTDDDLRVTAIAAAVAIGDTTPLIQSMNSESKSTRDGSVTALRKIADPSTIPALVGSLQGSDSEGREQIIRALSAIGTPSQLHLRHALGDPSTQVKLAALQGLKLDKSQSLMLLLIEMSKDDDADIRLAVVDAMQRFSDGRVVAPLARALEDSDERVARQARRSLDHLESVAARKGNSSDQ